MNKPVHNTLAAERRKARHYGMQALYQWHMAGAAVSVSVFRLASNQASKLDGADSPTNNGLKVVDRTANDDDTSAGVSLRLCPTVWHEAHVRPFPANVS